MRILARVTGDDALQPAELQADRLPDGRARITIRASGAKTDGTDRVCVITLDAAAETQLKAALGDARSESVGDHLRRHSLLGGVTAGK